MSAHLKKISQNTKLFGKTVLVRIDSDVDIENTKSAGKKIIIDDTRLLASDETIKHILKNGGDVMLLGHLGRPDGKRNLDLSLLPIAEWYAGKYKGKPVAQNFGEFHGWKITEHISLVENLRFDSREEDCDKEFARELALLGDIYVNDAFAVSHRKHASIVGICEFLPSYAGIHFAYEVEVLGKVLENPARPLVVVIGGAKIETKLPLVERMHHVADYVLVGGEIAEQDAVLITVQHEKIQGKKSLVLVGELTETKKDVTQKSIENFKQVLGLAQTIVWNGPMGLIRNKKDRTSEDTERGTRELAKAISSLEAYSVVGGGDTLAYLKELKLLNKFSFVSTGGGAMLEFLAGEKLPGIISLTS